MDIDSVEEYGETSASSDKGSKKRFEVKKVYESRIHLFRL